MTVLIWLHRLKAACGAFHQSQYRTFKAFYQPKTGPNKRWKTPSRGRLTRTHVNQQLAAKKVT